MIGLRQGVGVGDNQIDVGLVAALTASISNGNRKEPDSCSYVRDGTLI